MFTGSSGTNIAQQAHQLHLYHHNQHQNQQQQHAADTTNQGYTSNQDQRDLHQLSPENQLLSQNSTGQAHPQVYQQFRGSELFSIASQNCHSYHQPASTGFSSSVSCPQYLETNQSLVAHFSQHSTVALTNSGGLSNGISMSNASQFVSVMQQQQQQHHHHHHHHQHHTPHLDVGEVMSPALFFHHHNHSSHHVSTTTTNNQHHLHTNLSSSASFSGPSLPHLQSQQQQHQQQQQQQHQQHNSNHPLPRPRSSNAMLMSSIAAFDTTLCPAVNSTSNQSNVIDPPSNNVPKLDHSDSSVVCGSANDLVDPTSSTRSTTTGSNLTDSVPRSTNKHDWSLDKLNQPSRNNIPNTNRDHYSIQFEKLTIGAINGCNLGSNVILNNHSSSNNKQASNNNSSKSNRISSSNNSSKIQDKLDMRKSLESPRRTFACPTCSKGFTEKFNMKRHMQIHSQLRPKYICNECSKSFAWKDNFIRHRKAAHVTTLGQYQV